MRDNAFIKLPNNYHACYWVLLYTSYALLPVSTSDAHKSKYHQDFYLTDLLQISQGDHSMLPR